MDEMTRQNAALVEEMTGVIQSAASQVADLRSAVSFFRTSGSVGSSGGTGTDVDPAGQTAA
jgi:hypothetical protein